MFFLPQLIAIAAVSLRQVHGIVGLDQQLLGIGGITVETAPQFLALPNVKVCGGSWLTPADAVAANRYSGDAAAGRYDQARTALEAALRANPQYAVAHENLGDVYARLAEQAWARSLQIDAGNARLPGKLGAVRGLFDAPSSNPNR